MKHFLKLIILLNCILLYTTLSTANGKNIVDKADASFAIVVDHITASKLTQEIAAYSNVIKSRGLNPILVVDKCQHPDSIRQQLQKLYVTQHLEGAVFIGDIPVPMIRDAQHLTTAFKMDQRRDWKASSIPSDRFYDDFDLRFDYIKQDSTQTLYHYYSLRADSPQQIRCDIYSARIKPPKVPGKNKYELIGDYLKKVVAQSAEKPALNKILYFAGHGYNSNCMIARIDEKAALREQFPALNGKDRIEYIDYTFDDYVKYRLMATLQDPQIGLAILHHHGSDDAQLLNGSPKATEASRWIALAQKFFRGKIRSAKDTVAAKKYYVDNYAVPESWVNNAFDPRLVIADSVSDASMDINIPDMYGYVSNARVVILDACFNGSFHLDDYISGYYIFNPGQTMLVKANSVNTLQDTWTNQLMELFGRGVRAGLWARGQQTLESHLLGDPTFTFAYSGSSQPDINRAMMFEQENAAYWRKILQDKTQQRTPQEPGLRALAIKMLQQMGAMDSRELLSIQASDPSDIIRLQAFIQLAAMANQDLPKGILLGLQDSYELTRRLSALYAGKNGAPELLNAVAAAKIAPTTSARVDFQIKYASEQYTGATFIAAVKAQLTPTDTLWFNATKLKALERAMFRSDSLETADMQALFKAETPVKSKQFTISSLRNSCNPIHLNELLRFLKESDNPVLRLQLAEALGWYRYSYYKPEIINTCRQLLKTEKDSSVAKELQKTLNRLQ